jgi:hypothetical protein
VTPLEDSVKSAGSPTPATTVADDAPTAGVDGGRVKVVAATVPNGVLAGRVRPELEALQAEPAKPQTNTTKIEIALQLTEGPAPSEAALQVMPEADVRLAQPIAQQHLFTMAQMGKVHQACFHILHLHAQLIESGEDAPGFTLEVGRTTGTAMAVDGRRARRGFRRTSRSSLSHSGYDGLQLLQ